MPETGNLHLLASP